MTGCGPISAPARISSISTKRPLFAETSRLPAGGLAKLMRTNVHAAPILLAILSYVLLMSPQLASSAAQPHVPVADSGRVQEHLVELAHIGANPEGGVSRVAFSDADVAARAHVKRLMEAAGLEVRIDAAGNLIGRREGTDRKLPAIVVGSHTDSVPHGGNYDGDVGVMGGIEVAQQLCDRHLRLRHALEVVDFTDEEGGRVGSRAMAGDLSAATLDLVNTSGCNVRFQVGNSAP